MIIIIDAAEAQLKFYNNTKLISTMNIFGRRMALSMRMLSHIGCHPTLFRGKACFASLHKHSMQLTNKFSYAQPQMKSEVDALNENGKLQDYIKNPDMIVQLKSFGIQELFPIQVQTYEALFNGKDILASDRTGSGKTLAYSLPVIQRLRGEGAFSKKQKDPRILVMCPTRQLAIQVTDEIKKLSLDDLKVVAIYGGSSIDKQLDFIRRGLDIIVATPGRLIDLMERGALNFSELETVCIDQADTMLQKGFKQDVQQIYENISKTCNKKTQNIMFSATIPPWVQSIASKYFSNDKIIINLIARHSNKTSTTVKHYALYSEEDDKHSLITKLIQVYNPEERTIIFTQTKQQANQFIRFFQPEEFVILHGDISQYERQQNIKAFRQGKKKLLVATDVAARGLDIPNVELVVQLSPSENTEPFIHRSGRTGRAGKTGINICLFNRSNVDNLLKIQRQSNISFQCIEEPEKGANSFKLWTNKMSSLTEKIEEMGSQFSNAPLYRKYAQDLLSTNDPETIIMKLLKNFSSQQLELSSQITTQKNLISYQLRSKTGAQIDPQMIANNLQVKLLNAKVFENQLLFDVHEKEFAKIEQNKDKLSNEYDIQFYQSKKQGFRNLQQFSRSIGYSERSSNYRSGGYQSRQGRQNRYSNRSSGYQARGNSQNYRSRNNDEDNFMSGDNRSKPYEQRPRSSNECKAFLARLPEDASEEDVRAKIQELNLNPTSIKIAKTKPRDDGSTLKIGFVTFSNREDLVRLLTSNLYIGGEKIKMKESDK